MGGWVNQSDTKKLNLKYRLWENTNIPDAVNWKIKSSKFLLTTYYAMFSLLNSSNEMGIISNGLAH